MRKTLVLSLIVALSLVACKSEIDNKPAAVTTEPAPVDKPAEPMVDPTAEKVVEPTDKVADPAPVGEVVLTEVAVAPESTVEWVGGKAVGDEHKGGFKTFTGKMFLTPENKLTKLSFEVDTTSISSDDEKLTAHLQSADFFDTAQFPKASFETSSVAESSEVAGYTHTVTGNFTIHGVTKGITFPANFKVDGDAVEANSEFTINRKDFGINYAGKADNLIKDDVLLKLNLKGKVDKKS